MSMLDDPQILATLTERQLAGLCNYEKVREIQAAQDKLTQLNAGMAQARPVHPGLLGQLAQQATHTPGLSQLGGINPIPALWQHNPAPLPGQPFGNLLAAFSDLARYTQFTDDKDLDHICLQTIGDAIVMRAYVAADPGLYPWRHEERTLLLANAGTRFADCLRFVKIYASFRHDMFQPPIVAGAELATKLLDLPTGTHPTLISRLRAMTSATDSDRVLNAMALVDISTSSEERRRIATRELRSLTGSRPTFTKSDLLAIADEPTHVLNLRSSTDRLLSSISSADDLLANAD